MAALSAYCQTKDGSFSIKSTAHFVSCSLLRGVLRLLTIPKQMGLMRKPMITSNVQKLWSSKDTGQVEAVVGPYKIYDASLRTLSGHGWLSDEIIDAYLHCIMKLAKIPVHCLDAVLGSSVFHHGRFRVVQKMKLPTASTWICPVNVGGHWILVIVKMDEKSLLVIDHLEIFGRQEVSEGPWTIQTAKHNLQQDGSSCGVLILMSSFSKVEVSALLKQTQRRSQPQESKLQFTLLECKDGVEDLCVSCNMLQFDAEEDFTEMVQCDICLRWTHKECTSATLASEHFKCVKCVLNA
ncbi:uncharacterized protein LOC114556739 isoform X1 [Perca flavescens]|uniref:uncharacterized protein LOC114556739 isoform X1 n=1 Tax=Perca flavescens TaxID=8167 RepID=UPI00106E2812|nr:uncharacterized protein LOC114556739 isoform X1 [Perca flavescens]